MNYFAIFFLIVLSSLAATCVASAVLFGAWWHLGLSAMSATLAGAIYQEIDNL